MIFSIWNLELAPIDKEIPKDFKSYYFLFICALTVAFSYILSLVNLLV